VTGQRIALLLLVCVGAVYLAIVVGSPPGAFWTIDGGFKFLTVEQLAGTGFRDISIAYPGESIDPSGDFFPLKPPMATRVHGRFVPDVSLAFPILTAPLYRALSLPGLYVLPLISALACLWLTYLLARRYAGSWAPLAVPLVGLATPIFFYAVTFWEHNTAVLLTTAAVLLLARTEDRTPIGAALAAGLFLGMAVWFREECYLFAGSTILALLITRAGIRTVLGSAAGFTAAAVPLILFQWRVLGKPFGKRMQGASEFGLLPEETGPGITGYLSDRLETLYAWTLGLTQNLETTLAVSIPLLLGLVTFIVLGRKSRLLAVPWAGTVAYSVLVLLVLAGLDDRVFSTYFSGGFFTTAPLMAALLAGALAVTGTRRARGEAFIATAVLLFFCVAVILSPVKYQRGVHWGPRYLLPVFPLLVVLGLSGIRRACPDFRKRRFMLVLGSIILAFSLAVQTHGMATLQIKKRGTERTVSRFQESSPRTVVTNVWWFPLEIAVAYRKHPIYRVIDTEDYHALLRQFREAGIHRFTLVASPAEDRILRDPVASVLKIEPHLTPSMRYFDLLICECELKAGRED